MLVHLDPGYMKVIGPKFIIRGGNKSCPVTGMANCDVVSLLKPTINTAGKQT